METTPALLDPWHLQDNQRDVVGMHHSIVIIARWLVNRAHITGPVLITTGKLSFRSSDISGFAPASAKISHSRKLNPNWKDMMLYCQSTADPIQTPPALQTCLALPNCTLWFGIFLISTIHPIMWVQFAKASWTSWLSGFDPDKSLTGFRFKENKVK